VASQTHGDVSFKLTTHSHDTVDLRHVDVLVTEDGIKDKAAISEWINASSR
jgi:hypothetical protein